MKMNMMVLMYIKFYFMTCDINVSLLYMTLNLQHDQDMRAGVTQRNVHEWNYIIQCYDSA